MAGHVPAIRILDSRRRLTEKTLSPAPEVHAGHRFKSGIAFACVLQ
jgi:hypothetical protein